jgi:hypothetical protein
MNDFLAKVGQSTQKAAMRLCVRSALNPMLWLCAIVTPVCLIFAYLFKDVSEVRNWLLIVGLLPVVVTCLGFCGFAIFRPEKLQSEEYQLRHETLLIVQEKTGRITILPTPLDAIANPQAKQLLDEGDKNA